MKAGKLGKIVPESEMDGLVPSGHRVERAAGDFRRGVPVIVHVARQDYGPTEGCVALARGDLLEALAQMRTQDKLVVQL